MIPPPEKQVENRACYILQDLGFLCLKLTNEINGFPDRTIISPTGKVCCIAVYRVLRGMGRLSHKQVETIKRVIAKTNAVYLFKLMRTQPLPGCYDKRHRSLLKSH